jgi:hypothetical protein
MKKLFWFVLIAAVLVTLAAATWVVSALRAPIRRLTPDPQPQAA